MMLCPKCNCEVRRMDDNVYKCENCKKYFSINWIA